MNRHYLFAVILMSILSAPVAAAPKPEEDRNVNVPTSENPVIRKLENPDMPARESIPDIDKTGDTKPVPRPAEVKEQPHLFINIDTNKDGHISREEFNVTGDAAKFPLADKDGNGMISEDEFNAYYNEQSKSR